MATTAELDRLKTVTIEGGARRALALADHLTAYKDTGDPIHLANARMAAMDCQMAIAECVAIVRIYTVTNTKGTR